jgi:cytoskeletal protein CcmA (bactofilin family)
MFGRKGEISKPQSQITSLISPGTEIDGHISFKGGLRIDGHVTGNVTASGANPSMLVLGEERFIQGKICVSHAVINGTVLGPIQSHESLELLAQAKVTGSVYYKNIDIQLGATINGMARHLDDVQPGNKVVTFKLTHESEEVTSPD